MRESETSDTDNVCTLTGGKLGDLDAIRLILSIYLQGHPQRMRLQRRCTEFVQSVLFHLGFLVGKNWLLFILNH